MSADKIKLIAKQVQYYSELDESSFFAWLDKLPCIDRYYGQGSELFIDIKRDQVDDNSLREIIAIFERYKIEMSQLSVFVNEKNKKWFCDPQKYWFKRVFG